MKVWIVSLLVSFALGAKMRSYIRVVGGFAASEGDYPYQTSLRRKGEHFCGGSIIDETTILTAAHCLDDISISELSVVVGTNKLDSGGETYNVSEIRIHRQYDNANLKGDIAILKLKQSIRYTTAVQPIELETKDVGDGIECVLTGWGFLDANGSIINKLQQLDLTTVDLEFCITSLNTIAIDETHICTFTRYGEGACFGDSGGPLACNGKLVGIVSWGRACAIGYPDVFTQVSAYSYWIEQHLARRQCIK